MSLAQATEPVYTQGGITRTLLQELSLSDAYMLNVSIIEVQSGTNATPHIHPGIETGYVLEGGFTLAIEGRPDQPLKAGGSYAVPENAVHYAKVADGQSMKVLCFFAYETDKPLAILEGGKT